MSPLYLVFPEWQGSGTTSELYTGAHLIKDWLVIDQKFEFLEIPVEQSLELSVEENILGYKQIFSQMQIARNMMQKVNPSQIFTIGGSCGVEVLPVSYLNHKYNNDLAVVWLDAHGDLNTAECSRSKHFHGMPLRILLGEGNRNICNLSFSVLSANQIFLVGARDLDPQESEFIEARNIFLAKPQALLEQVDFLSQAIKCKGFSNLYIHLDLDVLEPNDFPFVKCPTPHGVGLTNLLHLLKTLVVDFNQVGFSVLEFSPQAENGAEEIKKIVEAGLSF